MKRAIRLFLTGWMMACILLSTAAAEPDGKIVYVANGGHGDGSSVSAPLGSLTDAYAALPHGGEIILCGKVRVPLNAGDTARNAFVEPPHDGKITIRGKTRSATLLFDDVFEYYMSGETEFCNLTISSGSRTSGLQIAARGHHLTMGDGLTMHATGSVQLGNDSEVGTKIYLYAGCANNVAYDGFTTCSNHLTVKSGSYWVIGGFNRNLNVTTTGHSTLELGGNVRTAYLIAGSSGSSAFAAPAGIDIFIRGDIRITKQLSLGNQNADVDSFDTNLILQDGKLDFTGDFIDYNARKRLTSLDIYVNDASAAAQASYAAHFAGYGDREGTLRAYCENERGGHDFADGICTVCGKAENVLNCTAHRFKSEMEGTVVKKSCETCGFTVRETKRTASTAGVYTYKAGNLRVQILADGIVRIEESADGSFTDAATLVVPDRSAFAGAAVISDTDENTTILSTARFTVNVPKGGGAADVRIFDKSGNPIYSYFETEKHGFYAALPAPAETPDVFVLTDNGILPPDEGLTYAGRTDAASGWTRSKNSDVYVLLPLGDAATLRADFVTLTGRTDLSDIKTLGSWYSKWTNYTAEQKLAMIARYRKENIPLDMIVIDTEWKNTSTNGNDGDGTGYDINTALYADMADFLRAAAAAGVRVLFNDHTHKTSLPITSPTELEWQSNGILKLLRLGLDGWWYDRNWTYAVKSPFSDVLFSTLGQVLYHDTIRKYNADAADGTPRRVLMLSNTDWIKHGHITGEPSVIGHRYGIQWSGDIYGDPLQLRREVENTVLAGVKGASPYLSSDLGGFWHNDTVTKNHFIRWMQYGAFSPVTRVHSTLSCKNEQLPWSYGADAQAIIKDYLDMRYHLMPYYYMLARENYDTGMPLLRRLDFYYPQYEEAADNTEYLIGKDILVAPFTSTEGDGNMAVPSDWLRTADGRPGLFAEYFNIDKSTAQSDYFTGTPVHTAIVPNVDFYWYTGSPHASVNKDYFTARFTGKITPAYDCYIGTLADNGARVYIDGKLWSDGYTSTQVRPFLNNKTPLKAGQTYDVTIEYYELSGKSILYFVCEPVVGKNMSSRSVFIPDGTWQNVFTGEKVTGPQSITVTGGIAEMPVYVRMGAAIPTAAVESPLTGGDWRELSVNLYGLSETAFTLYEDDGATEAYKGGEYRKTEVRISPIGTEAWQIHIGSGTGAFATDYTTRMVKLRVHTNIPVTAATVAGKPVTVRHIAQDATALPFAQSGASRLCDVYEIEAEVSLKAGAVICITTDAAADLDGDGTITVRDALFAMRQMGAAHSVDTVRSILEKAAK